MQEEGPRVSIVVPTRGRPEPLRRCLAALDEQTVAVEVVAVEDGEGRGPAWARNEGVRRAGAQAIDASTRNPSRATGEPVEAASARKQTAPASSEPIITRRRSW